ncbi:MAG: hypothetical protein I3273_01030 [Candidatus Moeniiplasma glomeromycotorum]|nr:hypothetical protein [Candidatus Moeniiplasma glomeromycotorum]MCE8167295.1 hypothetical protein [Candidatus Moeniiplasma glomeromycotorum]MCE8168692.1 hypothetical protein [Candidatus Moeniiplasma glomeromycotorum]
MKDKKLEKILGELENPNYQGGSWALSPNASPLEKSKYAICEKVVSYKQDNKLTIEEIAKKVELSQAEVEDILHYHLDYFTLDRLVVYANKLLAPNQEIKVIVEDTNA